MRREVRIRACPINPCAYLLVSVAYSLKGDTTRGMEKKKKKKKRKMQGVGPRIVRHQLRRSALHILNKSVSRIPRSFVCTNQIRHILTVHYRAQIIHRLLFIISQVMLSHRKPLAALAAAALFTAANAQTSTTCNPLDTSKHAQFYQNLSAIQYK
ncbi:hypothetical protein BX600DRAFT_227458 [Xylariales sp. PMI_506]|nr:hypothetical protein BX600DRAFT_227458 [Xylariales sp. PMI_506]